jgi:hypothetical protein
VSGWKCAANLVAGHPRRRLVRQFVGISQSKVDDLRRILRKAANTFDQKAMYLSVKGIVEFIAATTDDGFLA